MRRGFVVPVSQSFLLVIFNVQPGLIPVVAKAFGCGRLVDLEAAFAHGKGVLPAVTCKFDLDNPTGTRRDFFPHLP